MSNILFVCTGNTCRSPMAAALLKEKAHDVNVKSAGLFVICENEPANEKARHVLEEKGIDAAHHATALNQDLVGWADLILTMTEQHKQLLLQDFPTAAGKVHTLKAYVASESSDKPLSTDITDPFGGSIAQYRETLSELESLIDRLIAKRSH